MNKKVKKVLIPTNVVKNTTEEKVNEVKLAFTNYPKNRAKYLALKGKK